MTLLPEAIAVTLPALYTTEETRFGSTAVVQAIQ